MTDKKESIRDDTANSEFGSDSDSKQGVDRRIQAYQQKFRRLASELSLAEARERREIASDLHDHVGQALAFVSQKISTLQGNSIFSGMEDDFSKILEILDQTIRYTRNLTIEISPPVLYDLGLYPAIEWLAEKSTQKYEIQIEVSQSGKSSSVDESIKVFIFKTIKELISNTSKHAGAKLVDIKVNWGKDMFDVEVFDDGRGFDTSQFESGLYEGSCFGLFNIRERLSYIGGTFKLISSPGNGTRVSISSPYKTSDEADSD